MPEPEAFARGAERIVGQAGDIVLFDSCTVHAAAPNRSAARRRALTLCLGRPFMKPQMDWPRYLPPEFQARMSDRVRQIMGFNARVAASLDEYYQPPERWTFKADQR
jgi:ectoine hydroxylase-related dioxygenase (phytanoyl-CoA dioxygenase family)